MDLKKRNNCFGCGSKKMCLVWRKKDLALYRCMDCRSEWLEGYLPREPSYEYDHYEERPIEDLYVQGRARRFANYLEGFSRIPTMSLPNSRTLLDVGCGPGYFLIAANDLGWEPVGMELTEASAETARQKTQLRIIAGDITQCAPLGEQRFDAITLWGVLEHVPDPETLLVACRDLLLPNGMILMETPNSQALFRYVARHVMNATHDKIDRPFLETLGAGHVVWFSFEALRCIATRLGLEIVDIRGSRNSTRILLYRLRNLPLYTRLPFQLGTALLNVLAAPVGFPNQIIAVLRRR